MLAGMTGSDPKAELHFYLTRARDALLWKMDGLSEYNVRRPLVPTGTNLLGLVKHVASVAAGYFGECFGRPFGEPMPWLDDDAEPNADMWATAEVPWWPPERREPTLHRVLIHMIAETERHAGHADIVRELIDGSVGIRAEHSTLPPAPSPTGWSSPADNAASKPVKTSHYRRRDQPDHRSAST